MPTTQSILLPARSLVAVVPDIRPGDEVRLLSLIPAKQERPKMDVLAIVEGQALCQWGINGAQSTNFATFPVCCLEVWPA